MSESLEGLRAELASVKEKEKEKRKKLTENLRLVRDKLQLVVQLKERADKEVGQEREQRVQLQKEEQGLKSALAAEQQRCAAMQQAAEASQRDAAAAAAAARAAQANAATACKTADAALAAAAAAAEQLAAMQKQMQRFEAQCQALQQAVAAQPERAGASGELQREVELLHGQQASILAEMQRWRAAVTPLAALASGPALGVGGPQAPSAAQAPAPPAAADGAAERSPRKRQTKKQRRSAAQADREAPAAAAAATAAPAAPLVRPETDAEVRARAVAALRAGSGKRQAEAALPASAGAFNEGLGMVGVPLQPPSKRRQPASAAAAAAAPRHSPQHACGAPTAAAAGLAAEPSLAISANGLAEGQQGEEATAADEVAALLGRITSAAAPGGPGGTDPAAPSVQLVHSVAADLLRLLAEGRAPLQLLLACFETAVLECAAPKPQVQYLQHAQHSTADSGAAASPDAWFAAAAGRLAPAAADAATPPFAALWASRDALASHRLHWLLLCVVRMHELQRRHAALTAAAAAAHGSCRDQPVLPALRQHLHRLVLGSCLAAARRRGSVAADSDAPGGALRHTETETCALAAAAAGLCRAGGSAEACWALLLDLTCCPAAPAVLLPPLAAALDVWPALPDPPPAAGGAPAAGEPLPLATFHAALQHLCSAAEAAGEEPGEDGSPPPPLLLDRQPAAAALLVRRLGLRRWGWSEAAAGSADALLQLKATLASPPGQLPRQDRDAAPEDGTASGAGLGPSSPRAEPVADLRALLVCVAGGPVPPGLLDVAVEEI